MQNQGGRSDSSWINSMSSSSEFNTRYTSETQNEASSFGSQYQGDKHNSNVNNDNTWGNSWSSNAESSWGSRRV